MNSQAQPQPIKPVSAPNWAALIKQARTQLGESQAQFALRFGVSHVAVSNWENGRDEAPYAVTWWLVTQGATTSE